MVTWWERLLLRIVDCGEIPEHIAIIMDGNRRYARKRGYSSILEGHNDGAQKLRQVIEWLSHLHGVRILTVYAFSILNFERPADEVTDLMRLATDTFTQVLNESARFQREKCAIRFLGRRSLLAPEICELFDRVESTAPADPEFLLNLCVSYTSHDEIESARDRCFSEGVEPSLPEVFDRLELPKRPDLLIRTSGVKRMSNFLLLQCADTPIAVVDELWPELALATLARVLLRYQLRRSLPEPI
jgi:ditrans,polycis-polyprenyl diphosphate synthase